MTSVFIATGNAHKIAEIRAVLGADFVARSPLETGLRLEPAETGATFADNARLKAVAWAAHLADLPEAPVATWVLADDSGLEVDGLAGAPGVHSARFAALDDGRRGNSSDAENNAKLLRRLAAVPAAPRTARFRCVLALTPILPGRSVAERIAATRCFEGVCAGRIRERAAGAGGFGYDPLFIPTGHEASLAELGPAVKNSLSHRAQALVRLAAFLRGG